ncbi:hypothetical protein HPB48_009162 [Haemaphysalis longicornis]|uniref:Endonuclease/exonuclease/phosphatase domain-containing protein n=1 Tax=Haemaphysalis longicornis TaxID=44386 RepID=A0A9J6GC30_HAELO|nr:hypothetical protein HPB48_009162 [Haemaphysalis longicornis]
MHALPDLFPPNHGQFTFARRDGARTSIDVSFVSSRCHYIWSRAPDSWGSDHFPIFLTPFSNICSKKRSYKVTNWATFRARTADTPRNLTFSQVCLTVLKPVTKRYEVTQGQLTTDIKLLNHGAACRQSQRRAIRTNNPTDWNTNNRLDAACRRHSRGPDVNKAGFPYAPPSKMKRNPDEAGAS